MWKSKTTSSVEKKQGMSTSAEVSPAVSRVVDALLDVRVEIRELKGKLQAAESQIENHVIQQERSEAKFAEIAEQRRLLSDRVSQLTSERKDLSERCNNLQNQVTSSKEKLDTANDRCKTLEGEVANMKNERDKALDRCNGLERDTTRYRKERDNARAELRTHKERDEEEKLTQVTTDALKAFQQAESAAVVIKNQGQGANATNNGDLALGSQKNILVWKTLLATRTAELRELQAWWPKDKSLSGGNVAELVSGINLTISNIANTTAEKFEYLSGPRPCPTIQQEDKEEVLDIIGPELFKHLRNRDHSQDSLIVQLSLQTALVLTSSIVFSTWPVPYSNDMQRPMQTIFGKILIREHQIATWRWRVLGVKNVKLQYSGDYAAITSRMKNALIRMVTVIVLCAGLQANYADARTQVVELVGNDLERLWDLNTDLAEKTKEQISFVDYHTTYAKSGASFEKNTMQLQGSTCGGVKRRKLESKAKSTQKVEKVLCTVEMGLQRTSLSTNFQATGNADRGAVVVKPVVILESEIEALFRNDAK